MKNIHLIPIDKPSRLYLGDNGNFVFGMMQNSVRSKNDSFTNQNIYITSDEEIKDGEWCLLNNRLVVRYFKPPVESKSFKKIILTTDQDLIKDGVQAIDDEFLEWFVNNPSCDYIKIESQCLVEEKCACNSVKSVCKKPYYTFNYEIIIPKEEPTFENSIDNTMNIMSIANSMFGKKEEPKQETLEEAAENYGWRIKRNTFSDAVKANELAESAKQDFIAGAKWQQEQDKNKYSEEDMNDYADFCSNIALTKQIGFPFPTPKEWFEQFKKK